MNIIPIDISKYPEKNGYRIIDLSKGKKFKSRKDVLLYPKESFGGYEHIYDFIFCKKNNIKRVVYCSSLLLPIASLIADEIVMQDTDILLMYNAKCIGKYGFNRKEAYYLFDIDKKQEKRFDRCIEFNRKFKYTYKISEFYSKLDMLIDSRSIYFWNNFVSKYFDNEKIYCEIKNKHYSIGSELDKRFCDIMVGIDKSFQKEIISKYEGNKYYLTYQMLASVLNGCRFLAFGGSANLLSFALPVKLIGAFDQHDFLSEQMMCFKNIFTKKFYDINCVFFSKLIHHPQEDQSFLNDAVCLFIEKHLPNNNPAKDIKIIQ